MRYIFLLVLGDSSVVMTPLNIPCPITSFVTGHLTSLNKEAGEVMMCILSFPPDKAKTGGQCTKKYRTTTINPKKAISFICDARKNMFDSRLYEVVPISF